ncbi:hypothetical protein GpartN1_g5284.t1 [Galdieria partita]|uniref:RRM domain-containing protein n=1 Tax=Galdieria partita TaxID=83374 RepID=A0A9C7US74_9RHOD|nr:hypothetical protein GpartN1_g5284.t1 [Galdieria partita]
MAAVEDNRVFVGGLPWSVSEEDLRETFSKYGEVVDARVVVERETGRSRGFGFVSYAEGSSVEECIAALDGQDMQGRTIRVNKAMSREQREGGGDFPRRGGRGRYGGFRSGPYERRDFDRRRDHERRDNGHGYGGRGRSGGFRRREDFE